MCSLTTMNVPPVTPMLHRHYTCQRGRQVECVNNGQGQALSRRVPGQVTFHRKVRHRNRANDLKQGNRQREGEAVARKQKLDGDLYCYELGYLKGAWHLCRPHECCSHCTAPRMHRFGCGIHRLAFYICYPTHLDKILSPHAGKRIVCQGTESNQVGAIRINMNAPPKASKPGC